MTGLFRQKCDVYRPVKVTGTAQGIDHYTLVYSSVPCSVQPVTPQLQEWYFARGTNLTHTIYAQAGNTYHREDIFSWTDNAGTEHQFHLVSEPKDALLRNLYLELPAEEYPEGAKKRLDRQQ